MNIRFWVTSGKRVHQTLALGYGERAMKKSSIFEWHMPFKEAQVDVHINVKMVSQN